MSPSTTPAPCGHHTIFDYICLHKIFGSQKWCNQWHITNTSNAELIHADALPATLRAFVTIPIPSRDKPIYKHHKYLDNVHMDVIFFIVYHCTLLRVDIYINYCWNYGISSLTSTEVIILFRFFRGDDGDLLKRFHAVSFFAMKINSNKALKWIPTNKITIIAAPTDCQSSDGLAEHTWQTIIKMAWAYITEKQVGREFSYYEIWHSAMLNQIPGHLGCKITTPYKIVHKIKPQSETWSRNILCWLLWPWYWQRRLLLYLPSLYTWLLAEMTDPTQSSSTIQSPRATTTHQPSLLENLASQLPFFQNQFDFWWWLNMCHPTLQNRSSPWATRVLSRHSCLHR